MWSGPSSNTWFLWSTRVHNPNGILIGSAVFAGLTVATDQPTDRQTDTPRYSVCNNRPHLHCSGMQPNNKLCNIVVKDGTNQSHNVNCIYNVRLYQATNFLNAPPGSSYAPLSSPSVERRWSLLSVSANNFHEVSPFVWSDWLLTTWVVRG